MISDETKLSDLTVGQLKDIIKECMREESICNWRFNSPVQPSDYRFHTYEPTIDPSDRGPFCIDTNIGDNNG